MFIFISIYHCIYIDEYHYYYIIIYGYPYTVHNIYIYLSLSLPMDWFLCPEYKAPSAEHWCRCSVVHHPQQDLRMSAATWNWQELESLIADAGSQEYQRLCPVKPYFLFFFLLLHEILKSCIIFRLFSRHRKLGTLISHCQFQHPELRGFTDSKWPWRIRKSCSGPINFSVRLRASRDSCDQRWPKWVVHVARKYGYQFGPLHRFRRPLPTCRDFKPARPNMGDFCYINHSKMTIWKGTLIMKHWTWGTLFVRET